MPLTTLFWRPAQLLHREACLGLPQEPDDLRFRKSLLHVRLSATYNGGDVDFSTSWSRWLHETKPGRYCFNTSAAASATVGTPWPWRFSASG